jgi:hypothetical protein
MARPLSLPYFRIFCVGLGDVRKKVNNLLLEEEGTEDAPVEHPIGTPGSTGQGAQREDGERMTPSVLDDLHE